jgi:predicted dehydrogenase
LYYLKLNWLNLDPIYEDRDIFFDLALHPIDIINYLLGKNPEEVFATAELYRKKQGEELCFVSGKLGKTLISLDASWLTPEKTRNLALVGSKKSLFVDCLTQKMRLVDNQTLAVSEIPVTPSNALGEELKAFLASVENNSEPKVSAEKGLEIIKIIEAIRLSLKKRKPIKLKKL